MAISTSVKSLSFSILLPLPPKILSISAYAIEGDISSIIEPDNGENQLAQVMQDLILNY